MSERVVEIYSIKAENGDEFNLRAYVFQGCLYLNGQDFSKTAEEWFGDEEYEYSYVFSPDDTNKLLKILGGTDILTSVKEFFNGKMSNTEFRELCEKNNIKYETHVY